MKPRSLNILLLCALVTLLALSAYLLQQNSHYRDQNRRLILQNDSILSANLELLNGQAHTVQSAVQMDN